MRTSNFYIGHFFINISNHQNKSLECILYLFTLFPKHNSTQFIKLRTISRNLFLKLFSTTVYIEISISPYYVHLAHF